MRWRSGSVGDVGLALLVGLLGYADLTSSDVHVPSPHTVTASVFAAMAACLCVRRKRPVAALVVAAALFSVLNVAYGSSQSLGGLLVLLLLLYACGRYVERPRSLWGLAIGVAAMVVHEVFDASLVRPGDYVGAGFFDAAGLGAWILGAYQQTRRQLVSELHRRIDTAAGEERQRLARELHDVVAHGVTVMVLQAEAADAVLRTNPDAAELALRRVQDVGRSSLQELRRALGVLRADEGVALAPAPDAGQLDLLVQQTRDLGLEVTLSWTGGRAIEPVASVAVYRIVRESLTNVLRHSATRTACVDIEVGDQVSVVVSDDGPPRSNDTRGEGMGLVGMRARAEALGGSFNAGPCPPSGFRIRAVLPQGSP